MRSHVPEGPRFLRSDGTPDKSTRIHKEHKWHKEVVEPEFLHAPNSPTRVAVIEMLKRNISNVILAEGDKYQGVVELPRLAASLALWRDRDVPVYKVLLEPLKRFENKIEPISEESSDREVSLLLEKYPLLDEYPVITEEDKVVGVLPVREILSKYAPQLLSTPIKELDGEEVPVVGSIGEALMIMEEKMLPVVFVEDKTLDARSVLEVVWNNRRVKIGEIGYNASLKEPAIFKGEISVKDILSEINLSKVDYILVDDEGKVKYVPLGRIASKIFHP